MGVDKDRYRVELETARVEDLAEGKPVVMRFLDPGLREVGDLGRVVCEVERVLRAEKVHVWVRTCDDRFYRVELAEDAAPESGRGDQGRIGAGLVGWAEPSRKVACGDEVTRTLWALSEGVATVDAAERIPPPQGEADMEELRRRFASASPAQRLLLMRDQLDEMARDGRIVDGPAPAKPTKPTLRVIRGGKAG